MIDEIDRGNLPRIIGELIGVRVAALPNELRRHYAGAQSVALIDALPAEAKLVPPRLYPLGGKMPRSGQRRVALYCPPADLEHLE